MPPRPSTNRTVNSRPSHIKARSQLCACLARRVSSSHIPYGLCRELCHTIALSSRIQVPWHVVEIGAMLYPHVSHVVLVRAEPEMTGIDAVTHVTVMQAKQPIGDGSVVKPPRIPVGLLSSPASKVHDAVPAHINFAGIEPASIGTGVNVGMDPERANAPHRSVSKDFVKREKSACPANGPVSRLLPIFAWRELVEGIAVPADAANLRRIHWMAPPWAVPCSRPC